MIPGTPPLDTGCTYPVVPLEKYLEEGRGYCIQRSILVVLLLERLGIAARVVNGAVAGGPGESSGHTWVELAGGRVLDPSWSLLAPKGARDPNFPDRFQFGDSFRFENQRFPYLAAPPA